jgi:Beta-carotene isomerase D27-like, C-terminal
MLPTHTRERLRLAALLLVIARSASLVSTGSVLRRSVTQVARPSRSYVHSAISSTPHQLSGARASSMSLLDDDGATLSLGDWSSSEDSSSSSGSYFSSAPEPRSTSTASIVKADKKTRANPWATPSDQYRDGAFNRLKLWFICDRLAKTTDSETPFYPEYSSFVDLARAIQVHYPHPADQRQAILGMLTGILPRWLMGLYKLLFPPSRFSAELNAFMCTLVSHWLIGPSQVVAAEVTLLSPADQKQLTPTTTATDSSSSSSSSSGGLVATTTETWRSAVKVERCRYLETSQCKGACMNLCKLPTEAFFAQSLGMPLHMEPNFEDLSCTFTFGVHAPLPEHDPLLKEPCYKECPATAMLLAKRPKPCHTMPEHATAAATAATATISSK